MKSFLLLAALALSPALQAETPLLVVLTETGQTREGLPVLARHLDGAPVAAQLQRGLSGEMLHVYRGIQVRRNREDGTPVEPAYLLLSTRQGGFARFGFWLGAQKKAGVPFVDVHRDWEISGRLGAIDQIFPHELAHAILHQLAGEREGGANQVHAIGVRTDRFIAFNEGFAEHLQVMAIDHPGAAPSTRALATRHDLDDAARRHLESYRHELTASFAPLSRMRVGFPLWYSNDERTLRYFAVKRNAFAREAAVPEELLRARDRYAAYLLESTLPGNPTDPAKKPARMLASEGVVSALFHRWATDPQIQQRYREPSFYERFGTTANAVTPLENVYLKLYDVVKARRTLDARSLTMAYRETFPDEAPLVDAVVRDVFLGQTMDAGPELWLASPELTTGTTLFDQFRGMPRAHTFDLNAASIVDLTSIPGVSPELARAILRGAPYATIDDVARVSGVDAKLVARMKTMAAGMKSVTSSGAENVTMTAIFVPYLRRLGLALAVTALACGLAYRFVRSGARPGWFRTIAAGLAAAVLGLAATLITGSYLGGIAAMMIPFALPAALWQLRKTRRLQPALATAATWAVTAVPPIVAATPWLS